MSIELLEVLKLATVRYSTSNYLQRLTFVFSNDVRSPPLKSYSTEPQKTKNVLPGCIKSVEFGKFSDDALCQLKIYGDANTLLDIKGNNKPSSFDYVQLKANEEIVSVSVTTGGKSYVSKVVFIVYESGEEGI